MPTNHGVFIFIATIMVACLIIFVAMRRHDRKKEILIRRARFEMIRKGESHKHPREAIDWLAHELYGSTAVAAYTNRRYYFTENELGISPDDYRQVITTLLGIWWNELEFAQPTLSDALNPYRYFENKFNDIKAQMDAFAIGEDILGKNSPLLINNCVRTCCAILEKTLQFYPETPGTKPSVGELHEALQEYWNNPSRELQDKWQTWLKAAYLRQAKHILVRLRCGQYLFPESVQQVDNLLAYLTCVNAEPKAIGTRLAELQRLRGFMTSV